MPQRYWSVSTVEKAGVATEYGGPEGSPGAAFVWLNDKGGLHNCWFEIPAPFGSQALAVALSAISTGLSVDAWVGDKTDPEERNPRTNDPYCYRLYLRRA